MDLHKTTNRILSQLNFVVESTKKGGFNKPLLSLNNATIGQHVRHTLEFFLCLLSSKSTGVVCYDNRKHDKELESDAEKALITIQSIGNEVNSIKKDFKLILEGNYGLEDNDNFYSISTNFYRELAYNIEHAVHHMAIIKIGLAEANPTLELTSDFGVAVSTVRYNKEKA